MLKTRHLKPNNYLNMRDRIIANMRNNIFSIYRNVCVFRCNAVKKIVSAPVTIWHNICMLQYKITDKQKQIIHDAQMGCIGGLVVGCIILKYNE